MALSIKNSETERLARQVAQETGESLTAAIQKCAAGTLAAIETEAFRAHYDHETGRHLAPCRWPPNARYPARGGDFGVRRSGGTPLMVVDTSALLAIFLAEPERRQFLEAITQGEARYISAANVLETGIVLEARRGEAAGREFDLFLHHARLEVVPVDSDQIEIARVAWRKYGKGRHPAGLNFGDCFAYALAKVMDQPILFKGDNFTNTEIIPVIP